MKSIFIVIILKGRIVPASIGKGIMDRVDDLAIDGSYLLSIMNRRAVQAKRLHHSGKRFNDRAIPLPSFGQMRRRIQNFTMKRKRKRR